MAQITEYRLGEPLDLLEIERAAREMQAKAIADGFAALRRGIVALITRRPVALRA